MKKINLLLSLLLLFFISNINAQTKNDYKKYIPILKKHIFSDYKGMYKEAGDALKYPFLTPGSDQYSDVLWDWDSWLTNVALRQVLLEVGTEKEKNEAIKYEQGCIFNYLSYGGMNGWIPFRIARNSSERNKWMDEIVAAKGGLFETNMHKPCLAQHAAFIVKQTSEVEWLREKFYFLQAFVNAYRNHMTHRPTGLAFWADDTGIGVDNDPSTFGRPGKSSGSIYLNAMLYKELSAMVYLAENLGLPEIAEAYQEDADNLLNSIRAHCWDERDKFYYSVDLNLTDYHSPETWWELHIGGPRTWDCLIQRLDVWSGFMALWAGIATPEQAKMMVDNHFQDTTRFNSPFGIRTLSPLEKMFDPRASGNPSSWLGPVWISANYLVYKGLLNYGFKDEAKEMAIETIVLLGKDVEQHGAMHEYYLPDSGQPVLNLGFQNWNYLVINMIAWLEGNEVIEEF